MEPKIQIKILILHSKEFYIIYIVIMYIQGVHCNMLESKCIFLAEKLFSQAQNVFFLKVGRLAFMNIQKKI